MIDELKLIIDRVKPVKVKQVTLFFPHGADPGKIGKAMYDMQKTVGFNVSSGGYTPMDIHMTTFSDEAMTYDFGYERKAAAPEAGAKCK